MREREGAVYFIVLSPSGATGAPSIQSFHSSISQVPVMAMTPMNMASPMMTQQTQTQHHHQKELLADFSSGMRLCVTVSRLDLRRLRLLLLLRLRLLLLLLEYLEHP